MKILVLDIETCPNLAYVWRLWDEDIGVNQLVNATEVICWAAKWIGKHKVEFRSVFHNGKEEMLKTLWNMLDEADAVVHYNGRSFDIPHVNREFLIMGLSPPSPFAQIDLLRAVRRRFRFPSNKLEYVVEELGIGEKLKHEGFELWRRCMANEESAWRLMRQYNINDVALTELLYERILPWIPNIPSHSTFTDGDACPACGSKSLERRGVAHTRQSVYQRFVCRDCGKWSRGTRAEKRVTIREVAD